MVDVFPVFLLGSIARRWVGKADIDTWQASSLNRTC